MKTAIITLLLITPITLFSKVKFEFNYIDPIGMGLNSAKHAEARKALENAAEELGGWLDHEATIQIDIVSHTPGRIRRMPDELATAYPQFYKEPRTKKYKNIIWAKILEGKDLNGSKADAVISINLKQPFCYGNKIKHHESDFKCVIMHEITHCIGFATPRDLNVETVYSEHIIDKKGRPISKHRRHPKRTFFAGKNAMKANNGRPIPLDPYDYSHVDATYRRYRACLMKPSSDPGRLSTRCWSKYDAAILKDIGYKVVGNRS